MIRASGPVPILGGRVALVTGGGRGIGRAHDIALANAGAKVLVNDLGTALNGSGRDFEPAAGVAAEICEAGGTAIADVHDIASVSGGRAAVEAAQDHLGRLDIVVNNAGFAHGGGTSECPNEGEFDSLMAVHVKAAMGTMSAAIPHMRSQGYGRIINTVSEVALDARSGGSLGYSAAKAALWSITMTSASQVAEHRITVNAISPAARTRMSAEHLRSLGRAHDPDGGVSDLGPEHVARVVVYLSSPAAADVTGRVVHVAGRQLREYELHRTPNTALVERVSTALAPRRQI
jgi:NAD(P)-dependent dehydrogenase (short-subunit alcohol dehydrogenase family)